MSRRQAELLMAAVVFARSTGFLFAKIALSTMSVFNVMMVRFSIAFGVLLVIFFPKMRRITRVELLGGLEMGVSFYGMMTAEMYALRITPASTVSFLENTAIMLVPLVQAALTRRRPGRQELTPAGLALLGVACLTLRSGLGGVGRGELLGLTAALFYTAVILTTGRMARRGDPLVMGVVQIGVIAALGTVSAFVVETPRLPQTGGEWGSILALALVCSSFGFTFQPVAQRNLPAQRAAQFCAISPLSASVQGAVFYQEHLGPAGLVGAGLILTAILMRSGGAPEEKTATASEKPA